MDISETNQFYRGGRIDYTEAHQAQLAINGIDSAANALLAFAWLLDGSTARRKAVQPVLQELLYDVTAQVRADLKEIEMSGVVT